MECRLRIALRGLLSLCSGLVWQIARTNSAGTCGSVANYQDGDTI